MSEKREERISRTLPERARGFDVMTSREIPSRVSRVFAGDPREEGGKSRSAARLISVISIPSFPTLRSPLIELIARRRHSRRETEQPRESKARESARARALDARTGPAIEAGRSGTH